MTHVCAHTKLYNFHGKPLIRDQRVPAILRNITADNQLVTVVGTIGIRILFVQVRAESS